LEYAPQGNLAIPLDFAGPTPHLNFAAAAYASAAGKIYIFGGCDTGDWGSCTPRSEIFEFDPIARTNTVLGVELPYDLKGAVAAYVPNSNKIYVFGGLAPEFPSADILEFDVATRSLQVLSTKLPSGRRDACAAFVPESNQIYLFGGRATGTTLDEILALDASTGQLSILPTRLPVGLQRATAAYVPHAGQVFIFGGEKEGGGASSQVFAFNVTTGSTVQTAYTLPGNGLWDAAAIYAPESDWLAVLGGRTFFTWSDPWPQRYVGIVRLRCTNSSITRRDSFLPNATHTSSAVYVPETNKAYLFGGEGAEILEFDISTSQVFTMSASLPVTLTDPGVVWVPPCHRAYIFEGMAIYSYDPSSDTLNTLPVGLRTGPCVAAYVPDRDAIYLFDSANGDGSIIRYNLADGTLVTLDARLPSPRRGAYATYVPVTNAIYLFGGWGYREGAYLDDVLAFDIASETLSKLGCKLPLPGEYKASAYLPGTNSIYLLGGWGGWSEQYAFPFEEILRFDTAAQSFTTIALTLPQLLGNQAVVWASAEDRFYTLGGRGKTGPLTRYSTEWIYRFGCGHVEQAVAQSTRINSSGAAVQRAALNASQQLNGGSVSYFLSNNGGATWEAVTPGTEHIFSTQGSDLRWRAVLHGDGLNTPMIDQLTIDWLTEGATPTPTPTSTLTPTGTPTNTPTITATFIPHKIYLPIIMRS